MAQVITSKGLMDEALLRKVELSGEDEHAKYHVIEWYEIATDELVKRQPTVHLKKGLSVQGLLNLTQPRS